MVTVNDSICVTQIEDGVAENKRIMLFVGLSTDTKPTDTFNEVVIANGSVFLEMDTSTYYVYDESEPEWLEL